MDAWMKGEEGRDEKKEEEMGKDYCVVVEYSCPTTLCYL